MIFVLRLLHILSGAFWYGALIFQVRFLMPSIRAVGPPGGAIMAQLNQRGLTPAMMSSAIVNLISGVWLIYLVSGGAPGDWMRTGMGRTIAFGAALSILSMIIGMSVAPPTVKRLSAIAEAASKRGGPPTPEELAEVARLQKRMATATGIVAVLLTLTVAAMAVARYVM